MVPKNAPRRNAVSAVIACLPRVALRARQRLRQAIAFRLGLSKQRLPHSARIRIRPARFGFSQWCALRAVPVSTGDRSADQSQSVAAVWLRSLGGGVFAALRGGLVAAITQDWLQVGVAV